jgi:site-specific DNA recombinase
MKRIGLYIRVSTEEQARVQDGSLVSQRKRLEEYVEGQNRHDPDWGLITDIYVDEGRSAKDMNRPEFQRLLTDVRLGKVNLVLSTELSRMSRSIRDFCEIWDLFKKHDTNFITLREQFDTTTAAGEMMVFNLINFAQFERKQTGERIAANFKSRAERGLWNGGQVPLGYQRDSESPGKLLVHKTESKLVKLIFKQFLKTGNLRETCVYLNKLGMRSKKYKNKKGEIKGGNHFTVQSLHHLLVNSTFIGIREVNKKRGDLRQVKANWPAIVDKTTFNAVQRKLKSNKQKFKPDSWKTYPYPLTGLAVCGECGGSLNGKSAHGKTKKHYYYDHPRMLRADGKGHKHKCRIQRIRAPRGEELVMKSLKAILSDPNKINEAVAIYHKDQVKNQPLVIHGLKTTTDELKSLEKKQQNLIDRIAELPMKISAAPFYKQLEGLQAQISEKLRLKEELLNQSTKENNIRVLPSELTARIQRTVNALEKTPLKDQRKIIENVIQFAEFHPTRLRLGVYASEKSTRSSTTIKNGGERCATFEPLALPGQHDNGLFLLKNLGSRKCTFYFHSTSIPLPFHFHSTSIPLPT